MLFVSTIDSISRGLIEVCVDIIQWLSRVCEHSPVIFALIGAMRMRTRARTMRACACNAACAGGGRRASEGEAWSVDLFWSRRLCGGVVPRRSHSQTSPTQFIPGTPKISPGHHGPKSRATVPAIFREWVSTPDHWTAAGLGVLLDQSTTYTSLASEPALTMTWDSVISQSTPRSSIAIIICNLQESSLLL